MTTIIAEMDFETYSDAGYAWNDTANKWDGIPGAPGNKRGLPVVGAAAYAEHPSTEALCFAYDLKDGRGKRRWRPGMAPPFDLFNHLASGKLIEAWNVAFEDHIWRNVCMPQFGWPPLPPRQLRCAMAKARSHALPGALDETAIVLGTQRKDARGAALMKRFSMPCKPSKKHPFRRVLPSHDPVEFEAYCQYNETDIVAEAEASSRIPDLSATELELWFVDQAINRRGVQMDTKAIADCICIVEQAHGRYNAELREITGGTVQQASELEKLKGWLGGMGLYVDSLDEEGIEKELDGLRDAIKTGAFVPRPPGVAINPKHVQYTRVADYRKCLRALEIREAIGSASVKKLFSMRNQMSRAGRLHDLFSFHAARTGRPTGNGPQPTNLPNSGPDVLLCGCGRYHGKMLKACPWCACPVPPGKKSKEWGPAAVADALVVIASRSLALVEMVYGDAMAVISACLRGMFISAPGHDLICSDYSSIEAVVLAVLAGEQWRIDIFNTHGKIYEAGASAITGIPFAEYMHHYGYTDEEMALPEWWTRDPATKGSHHPTRKSIGKISELASGYAGWIGAWKNFGADEYFTDAEIKRHIVAWRAASPNIVEFWGGQHRGLPWEDDYRAELFGIEGMAISAILNPGVEYSFRGFTYVVHNDVLYLRLLSGRPLTYHRPRLTPSTRRADELQISYEGYNSNPKMGAKGWVRMETYSGKLVENIVQATARDIQTHGLVNLEGAGYPIVLHVYDEDIAEVPEGFGSVEEFERIMMDLPDWCRGWPIRAKDGWRSKRYRK